MKALVCAAAMMIPSGGATAATLQPQTARAWDAYVATVEARIESELPSPRNVLITTPQGKSVDVPDGLISHWRGSIFLPNIALDTLLNRLQHPSERGPHQEDVIALRVLDRRPHQLTLAIRMTRTKIVTVTYDTEHRINYRRHDPTRVSSTSVATSVVELDGAGSARERTKPPGEDRGFLWRLNSYWRYEQVGNGVIVELESLTLSRSIPLGLGTIVRPIINRIARESMERTLVNIRKTYAPPAVARRDDVS